MIEPEAAPNSIGAIALGGNLGNPRKTLEAALLTLDAWPGVRVERCSAWYHTAAIGPPQPDYLNGCAILRTSLPPVDLLHTLLAIETQFGRVRRERWGPRTLDLDLLLFDDVILATPELTLPHPRMVQRAFVLIPLAEIAADWREPITGRSIRDLAGQVDPAGVCRLSNC
jgi:2-amino-4-hydroxy-6-hydroxymethyldihydropteridine diphosphokinase